MPGYVAREQPPGPFFAYFVTYGLIAAAFGRYLNS